MSLKLLKDTESSPKVTNNNILTWLVVKQVINCSLFLLADGTWTREAN